MLKCAPDAAKPDRATTTEIALKDSLNWWPHSKSVAARTFPARSGAGDSGESHRPQCCRSACRPRS